MELVSTNYQPQGGLEIAAKEVFDAIAPIVPLQNCMVWAEPDNNCIMVGTEETAFTIRRKAIDAGLHIETAKALVPSLVQAVVAAGNVSMQAAYANEASGPGEVSDARPR